eukprot:TRINITY_DN25953_c1_g1_i12.p1 TRINITY_DN25953_c1_g1~~TRINITY_DN25953_c1_g1_i12.p1  ORF type:complete len:290 (-),score=39.98 TRINITY_DN25953_c1_g1_i12:308-1177(-)
MADFEDDWGEDSGETTPLPVPSTAKIWLSVLVGAAVVVCLPDDAACKSEMLWLWRARLRRQLLGFLEAVVKSPLVQLVAYLLRSISFGIFSARCRAPHSLSAKVVGSGHLLLRWRTRTPELNPLHQEHYVVACRTVEGHTTSSACAAGRQHSTEPSASGQDSDVWKEWRISDNLLVNEENSWAAVLDCLPRNSCLRLRVCAENRWGRSAWAQDELEDSNKVSALLHNELAEALHLKDGQKSRRHIMQPLRRAKFGAYPVRVRGYACGAAHLLTILQPMGSSLLGTLPTS